MRYTRCIVHVSAARARIGPPVRFVRTAVSAVDDGEIRPVACCEALAQACDNDGMHAACVRGRSIAIVARLRRQPTGRNSIRRWG